MTGRLALAETERWRSGMNELRNIDAASAEETLDPRDWTEAQALAHDMIDDAIDYLRDIRDRPVWQNMPADVQSFFETAAPRSPMPLTEVYRQVTEKLMPYPMGNIHPRF